jgi:hypothetical protein
MAFYHSRGEGSHVPLSTWPFTTFIPTKGNVLYPLCHIQGSRRLIRPTFVISFL